MGSLDSSSSEENLSLLQEAVDNQIFHEVLNASSNTKQNGRLNAVSYCQLENPNSLKCEHSLRPTKQEEQFNTLHVSPTFQEYVAKQLSKLLDSRLSCLIEYNLEENKIIKCKRKGGIRLLSDSKHFVKTKLPKIAVRNTTKKRDDKSSDSDMEKKCNEVAVKPEDVLNKKDVKYWSNRTKAHVYKYKKSKNGVLHEIE